MKGHVLEPSFVCAMKDAVKVLSLYCREHKEEFIARYDGQYILR